METLLPFFGTSAILGTLVTALIQWLKTRYSWTSDQTRIALISLCVIIGTVGFLITLNPEVLTLVVGVLTFAQSIYSLFAKPILGFSASK